VEAFQCGIVIFCFLEEVGTTKAHRLIDFSVIEKLEIVGVVLV
jgi:hypothetical protein